MSDLSNCCHANLMVHQSEEGTGHYSCAACGMACDPVTSHNDTNKQLREEKTPAQYLKDARESIGLLSCQMQTVMTDGSVGDKYQAVSMGVVNQWFDILDKRIAEALHTQEQEVRADERKSWYSPFDGLEIKLMYRDGNKVLQNRHIFSLEQINFVGSIFEVARLKFGYMLKDLLGSISQQSEGRQSGK